ncbi:delta-sarcoglycan-like [Oppia nitens]|uniref:delta-sarcoglycan-like n=1 Tax=Oppia nitens TaxID=1686743 RepID=UPI0023D9FB5D|nr:delta-sarcoglycan-like [Oppia nitens]
MLRNDDIIEDFVPTEQFSMHSMVDNNHQNSYHMNDEDSRHVMNSRTNTLTHRYNEFVNNCQTVDNNSEQLNFEQFVNNTGVGDAIPVVYHQQSLLVHEIGFKGWRKQCLYFFIILVTVAVVINAALTLWIIAVISFSMDGIGKLKIHTNGVHLSGEALLMSDVFADAIHSSKDQSLRIQSDDSIIINSRQTNSDGNNNDNNNIVANNRLVVANSRINAIANQFVVKGPDGRLLFLVNHKNVVIATDKLRVNNGAGIRFNGSIQVPLVESSIWHELNVLSPTRRIKIKGPQNVFINGNSSTANLLTTSATNTYLRSKEKIIHLNAKQIEFRGIKTAYPTKRGRTYPAIYQLCLCAHSGKLFIVPPEASCRADATVC